MTFEEKLDRVITLLECLLEDKARNVGFTHVATTLDVPSDIQKRLNDTFKLPEEESKPEAEAETEAPKFTHDDIKKLVSDKKNSGILAQDLKEVLNKCGYTKISDIADKDIDSVYNAFLSL